MNDPLSRVLLRWGDSALYWWPLTRLRPAKTTPLSPGFVLSRALSGLVWAGLPFLIAVGLWSGQLNANAFLLPGALGAIAATTAAALIRSAWNRRATLHRQCLEHGEPIPQPLPADPTPFERSLVEPVLVLAILGLALSIIYAVENLRGSLALRSFISDLRAANAPVTVADIVPPPVPDDRNLAFAPLLRPLTDFTRTGTPGSTVVWRDTNGFRRASEMLRVEHPSTSMARFVSDRKKARRAEPATPTTTEPEADDRRANWIFGAPIDLPLWQAYYHSLSNSPGTESPQSAAKDVLRALDRHATDLQELRAAAAARPECRFPLAYEDGFAMLLAPLATLKQASSFLRLRATALLADQRTDEAFADVLLAFRLSDSLADQPILISVLVRISIEQLTLQPVWEGCLHHRWNDTQLAALQSALANRNNLTALQRALDGERILANVFYDSLARGDHQGLAYLHGDSEESGLSTLIRLMPRGWIRHNQVAHGRYVRTIVGDLANAPHHAALPPGDAHFDRLIKRNTFSTVIASMLAPVLARTSDKAYEAEALRRLALTGLALERHRLATGTYPEQLTDLSPRFLPAVPIDPMDGKPLRYTRTQDGDFHLYSVGTDHVDNHGTRQDPSRKPRSSSNPRQDTDLVWR
jgi:type II secretory pathway pseudopilin PulG